METRLIYGSYPEIIVSENTQLQQEYLKDLISSYLLKDILAFEGVKKSKKIIDLLILLAFQIGKEVSYNELATQLSMSRNLVERYLDLLEQVFILVYPMDFKIWVFGGFKATKFADLNRPNIVNIKSVEIGELR